MEAADKLHIHFCLHVLFFLNLFLYVQLHWVFIAAHGLIVVASLLVEHGL